MREKARVHTTSRVVIDPAAAAVVAAVVVVVAEAGPHTSEVGMEGRGAADAAINQLLTSLIIRDRS